MWLPNCRSHLCYIIGEDSSISGLRLHFIQPVVVPTSFKLPLGTQRLNIWIYICQRITAFREADFYSIVSAGIVIKHSYIIFLTSELRKYFISVFLKFEMVMESADKEPQKKILKFKNIF